MSLETNGRAIARARIAAEAIAQSGSLDLGGLGLTLLPPGLLELTHLKSLNLGGGGWSRARGTIVPNQVAGRLERLGPLSKLEELNLAQTDCARLDFTAALPKLKSLNCRATAVTDLGPLADLPDLACVNISDTSIANLGPLADASGLIKLVCENAAVKDLTPLARLCRLEELVIYDIR
jgi:Leucine-rich repeat (LRR) protein